MYFEKAERSASACFTLAFRNGSITFCLPFLLLFAALAFCCFWGHLDYLNQRLLCFPALFLGKGLNVFVSTPQNFLVVFFRTGIQISADGFPFCCIGEAFFNFGG